MNILAFAASNSRNSINHKLIVHACDILESKHAAATTMLLDLNEFEMPIFSVDRQAADGVPMLAQKFYDAITACDALIVSFAEHNGSYSVAFKNVFDWASRIDMKVFQNKPMLLMSASVGKGGGANVLNTASTSLPHFGGVVKAGVSVGPFSECFDEAKGELIDITLAEKLSTGLDLLVAHQD